jgi:transitional endoplasmic reticulum ATPase
VLVPAPDERARLEIFKVHTKRMPLRGVNLKELARKTEGYSGADIEAVCREAAMAALREDPKAKVVRAKHFTQALRKVPPSLTKEIEEFYVKFLERQKRAVQRAEEERVRPPTYYG